MYELIYGFPLSGKSTFAEDARKKGYKVWDTDDALSKEEWDRFPSEMSAEDITNVLEKRNDLIDFNEFDYVVTNLTSYIPKADVKVVPDERFFKILILFSENANRLQVADLDTWLKWREDVAKIRGVIETDAFLNEIITLTPKIKE